MEYFEKKEGNIFFIPLFLPGGVKENVKNYKSFKFAENETYAYGRLIEKNDSTGDLIEIFKYTGEIPKDKSVILNSGRLTDPIHTTLAFDRSRWRFIFETDHYDKNKDSNYSEITFILGTENSFDLWKGGTKHRISNDEAKKYNPWTIFNPTRVEDAIKTNNLAQLKQ